ncbi:MAG: PEP-CTERM sorting domain-containing protein [Armatimonadetes bacterium]|nr:PEP-CTERM sorting domain-containing protein [Armatimonadota bacterium]
MGVVSQSGYEKGSQFDLAGNVTNQNAYANTTQGAYYDGTSDGRYNYGVDYVTGQVTQFDRNWSNSSALFQLNAFQTYPWITMNAADGSFWLGNYTTGGIEHYSHAGGFLGSFNTGLGQYNMTGLAFDSADGTLWMSSFNNANTLYQFDQAGNFLQSDVYTNTRAWYGMEFDAGNSAVPEPASLTALGLGAVGLLRRRNRK